MTAMLKLLPTVHVPSRDAEALGRALEIWLATGTVPVAHIVEDPDSEIADEATAESVERLSFDDLCASLGRSAARRFAA